MQALFKMHHSEWSWSNWRVFLLEDAIFVVCGHYGRRLCRLDLSFGWGHVVWDLLSRNVVLQLWHSIWNTLMQKANIARHPWCWFVDEIKSWNDGWLRVPWFTYSSWRHWCERVPICIWRILVGWSKPLACILWCGGTCLLCMHFFKGEIFCSFHVTLGVHMLDCGIKWLLSTNCKSVISLRDTLPGPILSVTTNHVCSSCSLDFGHFYQIIWIRNCFWLCLLLLLTLCPCRFSFHTQVMILERSYNRLFSLAVTSVDGYCLYIIIHNSMSYRTWS